MLSLDEANAVTGFDTQFLSNLKRNGDLPFGCNCSGSHKKPSTTIIA
jgi:hypothetical protein